MSQLWVAGWLCGNRNECSVEGLSAKSTNVWLFETLDICSSSFKTNLKSTRLLGSLFLCVSSRYRSHLESLEPKLENLESSGRASERVGLIRLGKGREGFTIHSVEIPFGGNQPRCSTRLLTISQWLKGQEGGLGHRPALFLQCSLYLHWRSHSWHLHGKALVSSGHLRGTPQPPT